MQSNFQKLKQRLDAINKLRINRAMSATCPMFQQVYSLLPTFLHYHHPMMPGYLDKKVPHGISFFTPNKKQIVYLNNLEKKSGSQLSDIFSGEMPIIGVYSMGSTSSVGQNYTSDLDIWVCHQPWLDNNERINLQQKCTALKKWCATMGVEVSFFLIDENLFKSNEDKILSGKKYTFTHKILLLDEFYRTAVRMAGKRILWNMIPYQEENDYDNYVISLYHKGILTPNEWLDLGRLGDLSSEEYFHASLWQLYKSIHSPYKAVLKTTLLEAYSWGYPSMCLLSTDTKKYLHDGKIVSFGFDSYCMMLKRLTYYLTSIDDHVRLDLVRRCFYFKVCKKLSVANEHYDWRREILRQQVKEWGWNNKRIAILDRYSEWKIPQNYSALHNELIDAIIQSYHNLIYFSLRNKFVGLAKKII